MVRACAELGVPVVPRGRGHRPVRRGQRGRRLRGARPGRDGRGPGDRPGQPAGRGRSPASVNNDLKAAVADHGLWYPPDPASAPWSTIGGNVATNAGGLCCLKYGVTRDYVLGLRAVVGGPVGYGDAVRLGRRTTKGVAGLRPGQPVRRLRGHAGRGHRGDAAAAARAGRHAAHGRRRVRRPGQRRAGRWRQITRRGLTPAVLELLDRACLRRGRGLEAPGPGGRRGRAAAGPGRHPGRVRRRRGRRDRRDASTTPARCGPSSRTDDAEAEALFAARRLAYPALERLGPVLTEDVCVPRSARARRCWPRSSEIGGPARRADRDHRARRRRQPAPAAHHPGRRRRGPRRGPGRVRRDAGRRRSRLGGTVTGEHGVGLLKRDGMRRELDPGAVAMQTAVRQALDPKGIFNPGKG